MFNFHGGTVMSGLTLPATNFMLFMKFHNSGHAFVVWGLMFLTFLSMFFLLATLVRFFINLGKCYEGFKYPENIPDVND